MSRIVIGYDGSEPSRAALRWGIEEARLRDALVTLLHAYTPFDPSVVYPGGYLHMELGERFSQESRLAGEKLLEEAVSMLGVEADGVAIERQVIAGPAAAALVEASGFADLIVLGSRGLGGFRSLLLGSVGQQVVHHAACPVVIMPAADRPRTTG